MEVTARLVEKVALKDLWQVDLHEADVIAVKKTHAFVANRHQTEVSQVNAVGERVTACVWVKVNIKPILNELLLIKYVDETYIGFAQEINNEIVWNEKMTLKRLDERFISKWAYLPQP